MQNDQELQIRERLSAREPLVITADGLPFTDTSNILEITKYSILKDFIYYEWGEEYVDYTIYNISDYGITWAFDKSELSDHRKNFLQTIKTMSSLDKLHVLVDPETDTRFIADYANSLEEDIIKGEIK